MEQLGLLFKTTFLLMLSFSFFAIPIIIIVCVYYYNSKKYKEESYYKITNISYYTIRHNTGRYGEYLTYKYLKGFEEAGAKFLFNIYIPKKEGETTEIDVLMISRKGIFVFESKNYSGWIFGTDNQKYWYQTLPTGRRRSHKESFYNPIFQNNTHLKYLKSMIGDKIPFYSIITFSDRCTLKNINIQKSNVSVINRYQVYNLVASIYNNNGDFLTDAQVDNIYNVLYPYTQISENTKQQHVINIYNNLNGIKINDNIIQTSVNESTVNNKDVIENTQNDLTNTIESNYESNVNKNNTNDEILNNVGDFCPLCGSKLVLRKAKRGDHVGESFYGCSSYPKCKYIRMIEEK